uniref:J domain-containing protein n=1 Tax=viral metagenome TaxID=1070528 RepID=A0A6C0H4Y2_9ZZZZ
MNYGRAMNYDIYFSILNISRDSTLNDIKKAYRLMSIKHHPDKNGNDKNGNDKNGNASSEQFNKINEAYSILMSNYDSIKLAEKKQDHEYVNKALVANPVNCYVNNANNAVNAVNDTMVSKYVNVINSNYEDIIINLALNYNEAYNGCNKPINVERKINVNNIIGHEKETLYVQIPKGIDNNEIITLVNKGNSYVNNGVSHSNVKIIIQLIPHELFERNGLDIIFIKSISLKEALLGFSFMLNHINSKSYNITCTEIIHFNYEKIKPAMGFMRDSFVGNLIIKFNIIFPVSLSLETKKQLATLL